LIKNVVSVALVVVAFGVFIYSSQFPADSTLNTVLNAVTALLITFAVFVHQFPWTRGRTGGATDAAANASNTTSEAGRK
jgi:hypothetical protein